MKTDTETLELVEKFVLYTAAQLGLTGSVDITLTDKPQEAPTAGQFSPVTKRITVSIRNRALADVLRTVAHEMTHLSQLQQGVVFPEEDHKLQPLENEANVSAGFCVRYFGRENKAIYADLG